MPTFTVTIKHPLGGEREVEFEATSKATAPRVAKGLDRIWAEQVVLDSIREVAETGEMSTSDGLGASRQPGEVFAETDPEHWPDGRPTFGRGR